MRRHVDAHGAAHAQDFLFRGIQKLEWANLFEFIQAKRLRVENLDEAAGGPGASGRALDLGDDIDNGMTPVLGVCNVTVARRLKSLVTLFGSVERGHLGEKRTAVGARLTLTTTVARSPPSMDLTSSHSCV